ncbi:FUSC family membrane protein [Pedobacter sp. SYSU D00535]|uniref:FUSC family protein n=1 Tax=Pedobacter sp. SYSU D00535 TaxID=2810308 RepID=UPI001A96912D|nr:FUSC family membrane protein [Pedobacter sp. SYSU D00535]
MRQTREIKNFLFSQYFSDGLRITLGVLLPSLIFSFSGELENGIIVSLGAITTSIPDSPGAFVHKRNGMVFSIVFMVLTALITGLINVSPYLLVAEIFFLCFFFSMFNLYGNRASSIGTGVLIIMILTIDREFTMASLLEYAGLLLSGGVWYMTLSLAVSQLQPYRVAQHALGESIDEVGKYLRLKARQYNPETDLNDNYRKLIDQQVLIHQHQDEVREILFKNRVISKDSSNTARLLKIIFSDVVDLFEQSMATHYDYQEIRSKYGYSVLKEFQNVITNVGLELEHLGHSINSNEKPRMLNDFKHQLEQLKYNIDITDNNYILKKILVNLRNIINRIQNIYGYFNQKKLESISLSSDKDLGRFVSHQAIDLKQFVDNLSFKSSIFRHSLRVAIVCVLGYLVSKLTSGAHSYWILLTILVILKPAFSLTKQRNYQRLVGTFIGGIAGALIILYVKDETTRFVFMLIFMLGAYSFQRINYVVNVLFMTPFILIMFSFIGYGNLSIVRERIIDTFIGSFIALVASYFIFPSWEYYQLKKYMGKLVVANYYYLLEVAKALTGKEFDLTEYKLVRKQVYVSSADMGSALQRMLSEPKSKQRYVKEVNQFIVLNHTLSSYIATLIAGIKNGEKASLTSGQLKTVRKALACLNESAAKFGKERIESADLTLKVVEQEEDLVAEDSFITEQLNFINQAAGDLLKVSQRFDEKGETAPQEAVSQA